MAKKDKDLEFGFMGEVYITPIKHIDHTDLTYWEDNPRIYNKIRRKTEESPIIQREIQNFFFSKDVAWTRELMALIIKATRVNEPLFVQFSEETKTYVVYEGNTRLAAVRRILQVSIKHKVPDDLPCRIIPHDVDQGVINAIVGQAHLKGKKDWDAFEANSYLYREFIYRKEKGDTDQEIYVSLKGEFGVAQNKVKNAIKTFKVNHKNLETSLSKNPILVTALNPLVGYEKAASIAKKAYKENRPTVSYTHLTLPTILLV